ncbi:DcaP family trimeric outer membrane transporter [Steroidobacter cummioxidans]|uniref:DcaP family trimeric outer membrane transporter n=1 Tax=Steroidobacter cummioxidans TaxID=1803913 RepID=UPI000E30DF80|nr:DcaP family trimeric outer membrane transporter [Steroidobacter cummioxidans]
MIKLRKVVIVSAIAATGMAGSLAARAAEAEADEQQHRLEARIEELERQLRELSEKMSGASASSATKATVDLPSVQTRPITPNAVAGTRFLYSGFVKLDALWSDYRDGEIADGSIGRDFYLPSTIPVGGVGEGVDFDSHIKQSRFIFGTDTDLANGGLLSSRLEVDLYGSALGDERATNTYGVQVRHAYMQYGRWLVGQTWSNFMDATTLPETADFIGPTDGTVFVRQPMVRYTLGNWSLSAENPETTITPFRGGTRIASDDNSIPDFTAAYTWKFGNGVLRAAALVRQLKYETTGAGAVNDATQGAALSLAGKINFGRHDLRFSITGGEGLGRYVGVNFANDAVLTASGELEAISGWAAFAAWRQVWNDRVRSTLMLSASDYDNDMSLTGGSANRSSWSWAINTFYSPLAKLDLGVELRVAAREIESGASGSMRRVQAVARYSF